MTMDNEVKVTSLVRYGNGDLPDPAKCIIAVWDGPYVRDRQCKRNRGHGGLELFCWQHARILADPRTHDNIG